MIEDIGDKQIRIKKGAFIGINSIDMAFCKSVRRTEVA
jgi:hypothetical protein